MILVAQNQAGHTPMQIVTISLILIGLLIVGCAAVLAVKRKLRQPDDLAGAAGFTLSDLRQMRKTGQISDEEFEKAKGLIVQASRRATEREMAAEPNSDLSVARQRAAERSRQEPTDDHENPEE